MTLARTLSFILGHPLNRSRRLSALGRFVAWQARSRLAREPVTVPFIEDAVLCVRKGMTGATGNIYCGLHEFEDMAFVLHFLRPDELFLDIGANVGTYTVLAGKACGARVLAVEPINSTFADLERNVVANRLNARVQRRQCGVGDKTENVLFTTTHDTTNHVVNEGAAVTHDCADVSLMTLDSLCDGMSPTLMKLDVEGFEQPALEGGAGLLANDSLLGVIIELNGSGSRYGHSDAGIHQMLTAHGFQSVTYSPFERTLTAIDKPSVSGNTLYVRGIDQLARRLVSAPLREVNGVRF